VSTADFRTRVRDVIEQFVPSSWKGLGAVDIDGRPELLARWRTTLEDNGLLGLSWPSQYGGGGLGVREESVLAEECVRAGLLAHPHPNDAFGFGLLGPTLLRWGTEEQKQYFLPRTISGEIRWAQGYSEPEAGSDLFALRTRAVRHGDRWIVNGQKIWQTSGVTANWIFALVRTDPDASARSAGISFLLVPLEQPGVEVRGITTMTAGVDLAEVFFTDAYADVDHLVGGENNGAKVALTLLGYERGAGGIASAQALHIELDRLIELARARGLNTNPAIRQRITECWTTVHTLHCIGVQTLDELDRNGTLGPESSITKLLGSEYHQRVTELALDVLGSEVLVPQGDDVVAHLGPQPLGLDPCSSVSWVNDYLQARPGTVYGGSSEVQRNTIAEQVLGLPREPKALKV
jgi:alkylation response protein AidB-like acyl-CoA dehydrogenase